MNHILPVFHYVLLNHNMMSESDIVKAMIYQHELYYRKKRFISFPQVLIALNLLHPQDFYHLHDYYGAMQEEPLLVFLRDEGYISEQEYRVFQKQAMEEDVYPGTVSPLSESLSLELLNHKFNQPQNTFSISIMKVLRTRKHAVQKMADLFVRLNYLSAEQVKQILPFQPYLPLKLKPLGDLLVLQGLVREDELLSTLVERVIPEKEPLIQILRNRFELWQINRLRSILTTSEIEGRNPAMSLVESGYISFGELIEKVKETYHERLGKSFAPLSRVS